MTGLTSINDDFYVPLRQWKQYFNAEEGSRGKYFLVYEGGCSNARG